jgi:uncharacterized protein YdhG (YjbR/CyaY superfamily)
MSSPQKKGVAMSDKQSATTKGRAPQFTDNEKAAMRERTKELKAEAVRGKDADAENDVLAKIAEMPEPDRAMAERIHAIVKANGPELKAKLWYGMPAYARDGKVVCFFKAAAKFQSRYATFGFEEAANLDDGSMWPTSYALTTLTSADEKKLGELVKKAAS